MATTTYRVPTFLGFCLVCVDGCGRTAARIAILNGFSVERGVQVREATADELAQAKEHGADVIDATVRPYQRSPEADREDADEAANEVTLTEQATEG